MMVVLADKLQEIEMINARKEFEQHAIRDGMPKLKCASIRYGREYWDEIKEFNLPVGFTDSHLASFLQLLDFKYDDGFGGQELFGKIWFEDGTFSLRGEYDGSEWWDHMVCPEIPEELRG